jgi:hypothetical protein
MILRQYNLTTGTLTRTFSGHTGYIAAITVSGDYVFSGGSVRAFISFIIYTSKGQYDSYVVYCNGNFCPQHGCDQCTHKCDSLASSAGKVRLRFL